MRSLVRPKPNSCIEDNSHIKGSSELLTLPLEMWLHIFGSLSPIDACNLMLVSHFFKNLVENEASIWTDHYCVSSSSPTSHKGTLHYAWVLKFKSLASRHKDTVLMLNSKLSIFSNDDIRIIISVDRAVLLAQQAQWNAAKAGMAAAFETAKLHGSTLPASAYIGFEEACVERAVLLAQKAQWNAAKAGMAAAFETAKLHGSSLPDSAYIDFEEACVERAVLLAQEAQWNAAKAGMAAAFETAKLHGSSLPDSAYIRFEEACVERAVLLAQEAQWNAAKAGMAAAFETAKLHGSSLPDSAYIRFEKACANKEV